ncbi:MAG TPA: hypothetical protein VK612_06850 [Pyrinomonadaceae bacterium]|nr:hypothetical protein [Pyrinomonadaceae bacterium]
MQEITIRIVEDGKELKVPMYLTQRPEITKRGYVRTYAMWTCFSPYVGNGYTGEFWVESFQMPSCGDMHWIECDRRPLESPVALFRDFGAMAPFLALYNFNDHTFAYKNWVFGDRFFEHPRISRVGAVYKHSITWMGSPQ